MYETLKKIGSFIFPKKLIKEKKSFFRSIISIRYIGNKYQCNICGFKMSGFIIDKNYGKICPKCGSLSRARRLYELIKNQTNGKSILHFSPSESIANAIKTLPHKSYITTDYANEFNALKNYDIESIDEESDVYDIIICYHVLEHVTNDSKAIKELFRVLKPNGICLIQTPFKEGQIYENYNVTSKKDRLLHFGQEDHVRIYSVSGLKNRLEIAGFKVEIEIFKEEPNNQIGFKTKETVLIAEK